MDGSDGRSVAKRDDEWRSTCAESATADIYVCAVKAHSRDELYSGTGGVPPTEVRYVVDVGNLGCWDADRRGDGPGPKQLSGCVGVFDY